ncbi:MAG: carboxypeptidase regulatory-like domain-containing protein [Phycisphaerales bacterium]
MRFGHQFFLVLVLSTICIAEIAQEFEIIVIDSNGLGIGGADVGLFELNSENHYVLSLKSNLQKTDIKGQIKIFAKFENEYCAFAAARKNNYFTGWQKIKCYEGQSQVTIILGKPKKFSGIVVDIDRKPIEGAIVQAMITSIQCSGEQLQSMNFDNDWFTSKTNNDGRFVISDIPSDGFADFSVEKPFYAKTYTFYKHCQRPGFQFKAGNDSIKITLEPEAVIKGRVIDANGTGIEGVPLLARSTIIFGSYISQSQTISQKGGYFEFRGLMAGKYKILNSVKNSGPCEWLINTYETHAVCEPNSTIHLLKASKGRLLMVKVIDEENKKPINGANIYLYSKMAEPDSYFNARKDTDSNGIVIISAPASDCNLNIWHSCFNQEEIKTDKENITIELTPYPKADGKVIDELGKPVEGISVQVRPLGKKTSITNNKGIFHIDAYESRTESSYLFAFDKITGLAGISKIADNIENILQVKLSPKRKLQVVDGNAEPITAARVELHFITSNYLSGTGIESFTDSNGYCSLGYVPDLPQDISYRVSVYASGYSPKSYQSLENWSEAIVLNKADQAVNGKVVDANGNAVSGIDLFCNSSNQGRFQTVTNADGCFVMENLSAGEVRLQAGLSGLRIKEAGHTVCQAGDVNVMIILGQQTSHQQTKSLTGKTLPNLETIGVKFKNDEIKDKAVVLCFVDMNQRPCRHCFKQLLEKTGQFEGKSIKIAIVQVGAAAVDINRPFYKGQVQSDQKILFEWGVKSLPWLIFTDKKHIIQAEGFSVNDLDEKIAEQE